MKNIKTTLSGLGLIVVGAVQFFVNKDTATAVTSVMSGIGLLFSKDAKPTLNEQSK